MSNFTTLHFAAFTHPGKKYRQNQDALLLNGSVHQEPGFWQGEIPLDTMKRFAIADGAGGLPSAAAASRRLLQELNELDQSRPQLSPRQRLIPLHNRLLKICKSQSKFQNAGSTLISAELATDGQLSLWHAGDSRGYHFSAQKLHQLTDDHTLAFCLGRSGRHTVTNLKGFSMTDTGKALDNFFIFSTDAEEPFIGLRQLKLMQGELVLMVSDGVTQYLKNEVLAECLSGNDLVENIKRIFDSVMTTQAEDNISALAFSLMDLNYNKL
jgi:serine/threonine protein phosphatase PrpC